MGNTTGECWTACYYVQKIAIIVLKNELKVMEIFETGLEFNLGTIN
jgi:hypothetical protein